MAVIGDWAATLPLAMRQVILREINREEASEILAAAARSCERLSGYLETLIGTEGARALQQRSIVLTRREHAWLAEALSPGPPSSPIAAARREPEVVMRSAVALLTTFVNLLVGFIGERLTVQVLHQVWPEVASMLQTSKESP
jgi:hypothetical protein